MTDLYDILYFFFQGIHEVDSEAILIGAATICDIASKRQYGQVILENVSIGD